MNRDELKAAIFSTFQAMVGKEKLAKSMGKDISHDEDIYHVIDLVEQSQDEVLSKALRAICLTRDYVMPIRLPPIEGWEWYDAGKALAEAIPDDEWAKQFWLRVHCPQPPTDDK